MAARQAIFVHEGSSKSSCVVSKTKSSKFNFHGNSYDISSSDNAGFETCLNVVKAVIIADNVHKPEELAGRDVVAFSYFYDLAIEAGLISGNLKDNYIIKNVFSSSNGEEYGEQKC